MEITKPRWRAKQATQTAGITHEALQKWRDRYGLLPNALIGVRTALFSTVDLCVLTLMATMTRRGFNTSDAAKQAEHVRPTLRKAAHQLLNLGRRPTATFKLEQLPVNGLQPINVTLDLSAIVEWVAQCLEVPIPAPKPTAQEAAAFLEHVSSPEFHAKLAALKREIDKRVPRTWSWLDVEIATGLPEWFALWALEQPRTRAHEQIQRARQDLEAMA